MPHFTITDLPLDGLKRIGKTRLGDKRGHLSRMFCPDELRQAGWTHSVAQVNHTLTAEKGVIRGMHFQREQQADVKLVSCIRGEVFDVAVDLREGSDTFGKWVGEVLSSENWHSFYIPEGFAHGFQTLSNDVEMLYVHSAAYSPDCEGGIHPLDPDVQIDWPLEVSTMSDRDQALPALAEFSNPL